MTQLDTLLAREQQLVRALACEPDNQDELAACLATLRATLAKSAYLWGSGAGEHLAQLEYGLVQRPRELRAKLGETRQAIARERGE